MLFVAAAVVGAMLIAFKDEPAALAASPAFRFDRPVATSLVNVYMVKIALSGDPSQDFSRPLE